MDTKILIEKYRGFDIEFDTNNEKFQCIITEEITKESISFTAIKKFVDDYKKENQDFKPFWVETIPSSWKSAKKLKIVGIRKDKRLIAENEKGEKEQVSDYDLSEYMLLSADNFDAMKALKELKDKEEKQRVENNEARNEIMAQLNIVNLKDYKKTLI